MEVREAIEKRRSVRVYEDRPIPEEKLKRVLEAARLAPSASNQQPWNFVVVQDVESRKKLGRAAGDQSFVGEAPVVIAAVALRTDHIMMCGVHSYPVDLAIAVDHITLAAVEEGLGSCWIGAFSQAEVKRILNIPKQYMVVALLPIGYPAETGGLKSRKPLETIVSYETFSE
ncbi:MAG: nitroreductase [Firmicutes bacterium]|jgi:nitroreductase|nr:nitroreductase [Bacillota bacterium]